MRVLGKITSYDKIVAYLKDPDGDNSGLTLKEREMVTRWMEAFTIIRNYSSHADAAAILMKRFPDISRSTAYRDIANAISVFGDISLAKKDGIRFLATELVRDAIKIARVKNNEEGMIRGAKALAEINGVNNNDPDLPDFSRLEPHTYELAMPEAFIKVFTAMISSGKIDLTQAVENMAAVAEEAEVLPIESSDVE